MQSLYLIQVKKNRASVDCIPMALNQYTVIPSAERMCHPSKRLHSLADNNIALRYITPIYWVFFSFDTPSIARRVSSARLSSLLSRPRVTKGFGAKSANNALQVTSINQHPMKSIAMALVNATLNYWDCQRGKENSSKEWNIQS